MMKFYGSRMDYDDELEDTEEERYKNKKYCRIDYYEDFEQEDDYYGITL